jgi:phosphoribosyl 1,2-cyclic phosphodiesterase
MGRITFLGTAGDSRVAGKYIRASGGIIIETGELQLHLDPGPGSLVKAAENKLNIRANTAVLVSNNNILNCSDVNAVIDAMTYGGTDKGGVLVANETVVNGTDELRPYLTDFHKNCVERIIVLHPEQKLGIEDVEIHSVKSINSDPNAIGFKIFTNEFILGYPSNTKYSKDIAKQYKGCDILILNVVVPGKEETENELNSEDAVKFINEAKPSLGIITHFGMQMIENEPLNEGREIQRQTGVQVLTAKDGMTLTPESYAAESKQKRLGLFKDQETGVVTADEEEKHIMQEEPSEDSSASIDEEKGEHQEHLEF